MAVATSTAVLIGAGLSAGIGGYQAHAQREAQQSAMARQKRAQDEALRLQMVERQRAVQADMERASKPSLASPLDSMPASTDRTGGLFEDRLRLARRTTLGGL